MTTDSNADICPRFRLPAGTEARACAHHQAAPDQGSTIVSVSCPDLGRVPGTYHHLSPITNHCQAVRPPGCLRVILATSDHHAESRARSPDQSVADKVAGVNFQRLCACRWDEGRSSGSRMMEPITSNYPGGRHLCEDATQESTKCLEVTFFVAQVSMFRWAAMSPSRWVPAQQ